jgi:hypothetical protein
LLNQRRVTKSGKECDTTFPLFSGMDLYSVWFEHQTGGKQFYQPTVEIQMTLKEDYDHLATWPEREREDGEKKRCYI